VKDGKTGVVTGMDRTHDPAQGIDSEALAAALLASRDSRIKYVISNKKVASGWAGPSPWKWRLHTGKNPHNHRVCLSVKADKALYESTKPWAIDLKVRRQRRKSRPRSPGIRFWWRAAGALK